MKKVLIVGNGGSSINPCAEGLYKGKDVFRVNKFFLEPNTLYGRDIKFVVFPGEPFFVFFIDYLIKKGLYRIDIVCYKKLHKQFFFPKVDTPMIVWDEYVESCKCKNSVPGFYNANQLNSKEQYRKITTGPYLINCAIQMGYTEISIIGVDFYSENSGGQYPIVIPKIWKKISPFEAHYRSVLANKKKGDSYDRGHGVAVDTAYIETLIANNKNIKFAIYIDEKSTHKKWKDIAKKSPDNILIHLMDDYQSNRPVSHCLSTIEAAILEYKSQYFWRDQVANYRHLFANRKAVVKKVIFRLIERFFKFF
ncbi:MAG: hypothetical protein H8D23_10570 [Candidatus Brocadiales bacterium]|nr:hypothetical protein [Candidatus Brocadiales bacterium]